METNATELAYAKLTCTLAITGVRDDGYHLIDSEMVTVDLADTLEFENGSGLTIRDEIDWLSDGASQDTSFAVPSDGSNLVSRALRLAEVDFFITLTKRIPAGAGLGGGSADAAAVLRHVGFQDIDAASRLGADVPFCIRGGRARVTGIGECIEPLPEVERSFIIVTPPFGIETASVYRAFDQLGHVRDPRGMNDLTAAAFAVEPRLREWSELLAMATGHEPVLAGSGSSLFVECAANERFHLAEAVTERVKMAKQRALIAPVTTVRSSGA